MAIKLLDFLLLLKIIDHSSSRLTVTYTELEYAYYVLSLLQQLCFLFTFIYF